MSAPLRYTLLTLIGMIAIIVMDHNGIDKKIATGFCILVVTCCFVADISTSRGTEP